MDDLLFPHARKVVRIRRQAGTKKWITEVVYAITDLPTHQAQRICLPDVTEKALAGLKFSAALPPRLAAAPLAVRHADVEAAATVLGEPVQFAYL